MKNVAKIAVDYRDPPPPGEEQYIVSMDHPGKFKDGKHEDEWLARVHDALCRNHPVVIHNDIFPEGHYDWDERTFERFLGRLDTPVQWIGVYCVR